MQQFQITTGPPTGQRNYVFVDEHNRHKRLKVMRACEATGGEDDQYDVVHYPETEALASQDNLGMTDGEKPAHLYPVTQPGVGAIIHSDYHTSAHSLVTAPTQQAGHFPRVDHYASVAGHGYDPNLAQTRHFTTDAQAQRYNHNGLPSLQRTETGSTTYTETAEDLSEQLGDLKIGENGIALYARQQDNNEPEPEAPLHDADDALPPLRTIAGSQIRIPPALMPSDEEALSYFQIYFQEINPYMPVLNRKSFYQQWHTDRSAMSPLLLEAVFACACRLTDQPAGGSQWVSLANRHEESFLDKPRLSTVQALILLMKAREGAPKRGYYYRSWMTCKTLVSMAKDLDLHEHYDCHQEGEDCGSDPTECLTKTRLWQTLLVLEMMVGAPQGRSDFGVDPKSVDISSAPLGSEGDDYERSMSRRYAYFVRNARNIRLITDASQKLRKKKDWGLDPEFVGYNQAFGKWPYELPPDLQISLPADGSVPQLTSHFVGNMHTHFRLGIVMLRRPQLVAAKSFSDEAWREQLSQCYTSSKVLCRLQEAILQQFGATGLLCMVRGINFTVYAILTCTMIHMIALTSPDPAFNSDAREFFTRHMRVLEQCITWSMPETQEQIHALRAAFSEDLNRPFELKSSFPHGSPSERSRASISPAQEPPMPQLQATSNTHYQHLQIPTSNVTYLTPPVSAVDSQPETPQSYPQYQSEITTYQHIPSAGYHQNPAMLDTTHWNPTPIIDQFNTAFAIPSSAFAPPPVSTYAAVPRQGSFDSHNVPRQGSFDSSSYSPQDYAISYASTSHPQQYAQPVSNISQPLSLPQTQRPQQVPSYDSGIKPQYQTPGVTYVSAKDWQQSVATVLDSSGLKRRWNADSSYTMDDQAQKRIR